MSVQLDALGALILATLDAEPETNILTDAELVKLSNIQDEATKNLGALADQDDVTEAQISDLKAYLQDLTGESINSLLDVDLSALADGHGIYWDVASGSFKNAAPSGGGGGITWGTPIDADVTVDVDDTRTIGTLIAAIANIFVKKFNVNGVEINNAAELKEFIGIAASDETTDLTVGAAKVTMRMPYAFNLSSVKANVTTAATGAKLTIDVKKNGVSIFSTLLTLDDGSKTSVGASVAAVLSTTTFAADDEVTVGITQVGSTVAGTGLKVVLVGIQA
jgi:hypothetical protein